MVALTALGSETRFFVFCAINLSVLMVELEQNFFILMALIGNFFRDTKEIKSSRYPPVSPIQYGMCNLLPFLCSDLFVRAISASMVKSGLSA